MSGRGFGPTKVVLEQRLLGFGVRGGPDAADGIVPIVEGVEGAVIEVAQEGMLKAVIRRVGIHQHGTGRLGGEVAEFNIKSETFRRHKPGPKPKVSDTQDNPKSGTDPKLALVVEGVATYQQKQPADPNTGALPVWASVGPKLSTSGQNRNGGGGFGPMVCTLSTWLR